MPRYIKCPNGQILLHPVTCRPTDDSTAEQVDDDGQINPIFAGSDRTDVTSLFPIGSVGQEMDVENVCRETRSISAVGRDFIPVGAHRADPVKLYQPPGAT